MYDWDATFGELRSLLQNETLSVSEMRTLTTLLREARKEDLQRYANEWSPYLMNSPFVWASVSPLRGLKVLLTQWHNIYVHTSRDGRSSPIYDVGVLNDDYEFIIGSHKGLSSDEFIIAPDERPHLVALWSALQPIIIHELAKYPKDRHKLYFLDEPHQDCSGSVKHITTGVGRLEHGAFLVYNQQDREYTTWHLEITVAEALGDEDALAQLLLQPDPEGVLDDMLRSPNNYQEWFTSRSWKGFRSVLGSDASDMSSYSIWVDTEDSYGAGQLGFDMGSGWPFDAEMVGEDYCELEHTIKSRGVTNFDLDLGVLFLEDMIESLST